ncbi:tyrosine-type recombinase/integrase [Clostridioides difficile]|nr:tyrosine-type recombinase/integrase [Clostridioides difficile]HBF7898339.1 tyrosine-type recombinase/integrase [Clostridioides difficile]HBF7900951.1 tyrosine-type recombinase/integrase [Clostridioides difficile]
MLHTFCTRLANKNMNSKSLQYIMGHSNTNITLNLYTHASLDDVKVEIVSLIAQGIYHFPKSYVSK